MPKKMDWIGISIGVNHKIVSALTQSWGLQQNPQQKKKIIMNYRQEYKSQGLLF